VIKLLTYRWNWRHTLISKEVQAYLSHIVGMKWYNTFLNYEQYGVDVSVLHQNLELKTLCNIVPHIMITSSILCNSITHHIYVIMIILCSHWNAGMFAGLKSHGWKYYLLIYRERKIPLIYRERKILLVDRKSTAYKTSELWLMLMLKYCKRKHCSFAEK
jgi:hypothetical protein